MRLIDDAKVTGKIQMGLWRDLDAPKRSPDVPARLHKSAPERGIKWSGEIDTFDDPADCWGDFFHIKHGPSPHQKNYARVIHIFDKQNSAPAFLSCSTST